MAKQAGLKRLVIALAVAWAAYWSYKAYRSYSYMQDALASQRILESHGIRATGRNAWYEAAQASFQTNLLWLVLPIVAAALAYWVYRGFKPRD